MDFIFGLAPNSLDRTSILVFVDRFSKMTHLVPVHAKITAAETVMHFVDAVYRHHGLPENIVLDRDPRFTAVFWTSLFELLVTKLQMSTAAHPETDEQTERVKRVLNDVLQAMLLHLQLVAHSYHLLSLHLTMLCTRQQG